MIENPVTGKKYRILADEEEDIWDRVSFWKKASDIELKDGTNLQDYIDNIRGSANTT